MQNILTSFRNGFKNPLVMNSAIKNLAAGFVIGLILASAGVTLFTWQFWAILALFIIMD